MQTGQHKKTISCYCLKLRRASAAVTQFYDGMLDSCGITVRQYSLLLNISKAGQCSVRELADMTELDRSTLARSLKPLFHQKLVIDAKQQGARNSQLELTQAGMETVRLAGRSWVKAQDHVRQKLGKEGLSALEDVLNLLEAL